MGNKAWWCLVKENHGTSRQDSIPPLTKQDGTLATTTTTKEKAKVLANPTTHNMKVEAPHHPLPRVEQQCQETVTKVEVTQTQVKQLLRGLDTKKATC